jgi:group I intron endonuclease
MSFVGHVYLITNKVNLKQYVGCTLWSVQRRWKRHLTMAKTGSQQLIHKAIRKYGGDGFFVETLEYVSGTKSDLLVAEKRHVQLRNSLVPNGYNLTPGGSGVDHNTPEFRKVYLEAMAKVHSDPEWQEAVADANRKKSQDPKFQETMLAAMHKMHADPEYIQIRAEAARKMAENPEWQMAHAERNRQKSLDPEWQEAHGSAMRERAKDPEWRRKNAAAMKKLAKDPSWLAKVRVNGRKAGDKATAKALLRDQQVCPKERERRIKNRAYHAQWVTKKRIENAAVHDQM